MEQRRSHGDRRSCWHRIRLESKRKPQADEDDTYVLDGAVGQELLQVTLKNSREQAHHCARGAEHQQRYTPPPSRRAAEVENDADEAIDGDLGHDAAHERRDMARRCRMRQR